MKKHLFASGILYTLSAICSAGATVLLGHLFDQALYKTAEYSSISIMVAVALPLLACLFTTLGRNSNLKYASACADERSSNVLKTMFARRTSTFRSIEQSVYLNILTQDISSIRIFYDNVFPLIIQDSTIVLCTFIGIAALSPWLMPLMLGGAVIIYFTSKAFLPMLEESRMQYSRSNEDAIRRMQETVEGLGDIRASGKVDDYLRQVNHAVLQRVKRRFRVDVIQYISFFSGGYAGIFFQMLICIASVILSSKGLLSVGSILVTYRLYDQYRNSLNNFFEHVLTRRSAKKLLEKVDQYTDYQAEESVTPLVPEVTSYKLQCRNLSVRYDENILFSGFTYSFEEGGCYVIAGESGSGKTTLLKLLCGLEQASDGGVYLGGYEIHSWREEMLGSIIAYIEQSPVVFDATLKENICLGRARELSSEVYDNILKATGLQEVEKRMKVSGIKNTLSGGEQKRLAIARALAQGAKILLMDEPTSALDKESAQSILEMIFGMTHVTRILVTHDSVSEYASHITDFVDMRAVRKEEPHE